MIFNISYKKQPNVVEKSITQNGTYVAENEGKDGYSQVTVNVTPSLAEKNISQNGTYSAANDGVQGFSAVTVSIPSPSLQEKNITPGTSVQQVVADEGYYGLSKVTVSAVNANENLQTLKTPSFIIKGSYLILNKENGQWSDTHKLYADGVFVANIGELTDLSQHFSTSGTRSLQVKDENSSNLFITSQNSSAVNYTHLVPSLDLLFEQGLEYATVSGKNPSLASTVVVPEYIFSNNQLLRVLKIKKAGLKNDTSFNSFSSSSVEFIQDEAFYGCNALENLSIPALKEIIGDNVFNGCGFSVLDLSSVVLYKGQQLAMNCASLTTVNLPMSAPYKINYRDFANCTSLESIEIPSNVTEIAINAFYNSGLKYLSLKGQNIALGTNAFYGTPLHTGSGLILVPSQYITDYLSNSDFSGYESYIVPVCESSQGASLPGSVTANSKLYVFTYYSSLQNAAAKTNPLSTSGSAYTVESDGTYYGRLEESAGPCEYTVTINFEPQSVECISYYRNDDPEVFQNLSWNDESFVIENVSFLSFSIRIPEEIEFMDCSAIIKDENGDEVIMSESEPLIITQDRTFTVEVV